MYYYVSFQTITMLYTSNAHLHNTDITNITVIDVIHYFLCSLGWRWNNQRIKNTVLFISLFLQSNYQRMSRYLISLLAHSERRKNDKQNKVTNKNFSMKKYHLLQLYSLHWIYLIHLIYLILKKLRW